MRKITHNRLHSLPDLPVTSALPQIRQALDQFRRGVFCAPPGSGKTTVTPLALLNEPWLGDRTILLVEPRRLAARLTAYYMAEQLGEKVGSTVGYQVRFDRKISGDTRIEVITEGILIRRLQQDIGLEKTGLILFDEFHERSLESDLALALCLDVADSLRDDLRLLVMSATIDPEPVSRLLGGAPIITCEGTMFPVEVVSKPPPPELDSSRSDHVAINVARAVRMALEKKEGDILAFLPGAAEIRQAARKLETLQGDDVVLLPLYGNLSLAEQSRAVRPDPQKRRRVILATTIAETSITIEGISTVIDCGWKRVPRFDPNSGLTRLATVRISKASAAQRQGRAGRLGPGICYRLWGSGVEHGLREYDRPEILEADLAGPVLQLARWGSCEPDDFKWLDPPPRGAFSQAVSLLKQLGALGRENHITEQGRKMAELPLHPRLACMILNARYAGARKQACDIAALLSERDILKDRDRSVDIGDRLHALDVYRQEGAAAARSLGADGRTCRRINDISRQLVDLVRAGPSGSEDKVAPGLLLAHAFPDRIGGQRKGSSLRYKLTSGRGAVLPGHDRIAAFPFIVVAAMDAGKRDGHIYLGAPVSRQDLFEQFGDHLDRVEDISWNGGTGSVSARTRTMLGDLVLDEKPLAEPDPEAVQAALLEGIRSVGLDILPWTRKARLLQARVNCIAHWQPEEEWPDLGEEYLLETLEEWLGPFLQSVGNREQLQGLNMEQILASRLDWDQASRLDRDAPTHIRVPSGSRIKLQYSEGEPPVLAVRLQEMFGLADTPTICRGRVPVLLHLLSPAQRPLQVTSDLKGFWDGSYHEVKKEMKGRYPKHYWPDNPWEATPTRRVKPKK